MAGRPPSRRLHVRNLPPYAFPARTLVPSLTRSRSLLRLDMEATLWKRFLPYTSCSPLWALWPSQSASSSGWYPHGPGKIQKYFRNVLTAGARRADRFAPKAGLSGLSFHPLPCGAIPVPGHRLSAKRPLRPSRSDPAAIPRPRNASARIIVYISFSPRIFSRTPSSPFRAPPPYWF